MALFIGVMSGTSFDGIDVAIVDFQADRFEVIATHFMPYPAALRQQLILLSRQCQASFAELGALDVTLGEYYAKACLSVLDKASVKPKEVCAIGCHGQTLYHSPTGPNPFSWQLGDANVLYARTGITTIVDFRGMDVAVGGEGAPLAPGFHAEYFSSSDESRAIVNIGGIANVTLLSTQMPVIGFDTGPGNVLMDLWASTHFQVNYDKNGRIASQHPYDPGLLAQMLADPYFQLSPPKSTGREAFNLAWIEKQLRRIDTSIPPGRVLSTLCELTAVSISMGIHQHHFRPKGIYLCGGGAHNATLVSRLQHLTKHAVVTNTSALGLDPDWVEAVTFAWLAQCTLAKKAGNIRGVTGATRDMVLGAVYGGNRG